MVLLNRSYFYYSSHFYASADHNFAEQSRLFTSMVKKTAIGLKFTEANKVNIQSNRESLRTAFDTLVSVEEMKAKNLKDELVDEKEKRLDAEKREAVEKANASGAKATIKAMEDATAERM